MIAPRGFLGRLPELPSLESPRSLADRTHAAHGCVASMDVEPAHRLRFRRLEGRGRVNSSQPWGRCRMLSAGRPASGRSEPVLFLCNRSAATRGLASDVRLRRLTGMLARKGYPGGMSMRVVRDALAAEGRAAEADA